MSLVSPLVRDYTPSTLPCMSHTQTRLLAGAGALLLTAGALIASAGAADARAYPAHTGIVSTTFWVGEIFNATAADGSQVCSTYDSQWALHWSGISNGSKAGSGTDCAGAPLGGCDGVPSGTGSAFKCATERRSSANGYFPTSVPTPKENPFYLDLPFDDLNDSTAFGQRATVVPWANDPGFAGNAANGSFSYMKNRWVKLTKGSATCYAQIEDAGPGQYHDVNYVFGAGDARPASRQFNGAGMDVSPAVNGCLGFAELDGQSDVVGWSFIDAAAVPAGPWAQVVTVSQVDDAAPSAAYRTAITPGGTVVGSTAPATSVSTTAPATTSSQVSPPTTTTTAPPRCHRNHHRCR